MCLLISGVGERGITLKATNYGVALGVFPGLPSLRQFLSRIVRHGTHTDLPPDKRWAKILTMSLSPPVKSSMPYSRDEFRYLLKEMNDEVAASLWGRVCERSVNCPFIPPVNRGASGARSSSEEMTEERDKAECAWSLGKEINRANFDTFYQILHIAYVKKIIHRCELISPIWTLADLRDKILSDIVRKVPHNMSYTSDVAICEAIVDLCNNEEGQLQSVGKERDLTVLSPSMVKRDDIILTTGIARRGPRALTIFTAPIPHHGITWTPLGRTVGPQSIEEIQRVADHIGEISGHREKTSLFDRIIGKPGIVAVLRKDFELEGPLFKLLKKSQGIVWAGDDESHLIFATNRLKAMVKEEKASATSTAAAPASSPLKPIGFIIGKEYHSYKGKRWEKQTLPLTDASATKQWEICAIFAPGAAVSHGRWHTRTKIRPNPSSVSDLRKVQSGMACLSLTPKLLKEYAKKLGLTIEGGKTEKCAQLESVLLEKQLSNEGKKVRFIYTPFEEPPSAKL